jgi:broad specificity phosphatase PhoE
VRTSPLGRRVFVARHGETDWNAEERWQGHTDIPLNEVGQLQARLLAMRLRSHAIGGVVTSDLSRAAETGRIVAAELGVGVVYVDSALRERSFGVFEGLTRHECETLHAEEWQAWLDHKRVPPGGEAQEALSARIVAAIGRVGEAIARDDAPALVVTHGGALRALVLAVTGTMTTPVKNGAVWIGTWDGRVVDMQAM